MSRQSIQSMCKVQPCLIGGSFSLSLQLLGASCALILSTVYAHPPEGVWKKKLTWKEDWVQVWKTIKKEAWETKWKKVSVPIWKEVQVRIRHTPNLDSSTQLCVCLGACVEGGAGARLEDC